MLYENIDRQHAHEYGIFGAWAEDGDHGVVVVREVEASVS